MNCESLKILKAALLCAAFLFPLFPATSIRAQENEADGYKQKATDFLLQKKKSQAILLIQSQIKSETSAGKKDEATEFLVKTAQKFIFREAQEAYENSINLTLENSKEAANSNDRCLAIEPQQLDCLVQKARLHSRDKNLRAFGETAAKIKDLVPHSKFENWMEQLRTKSAPDFKSKQLIKIIPEKLSEENIGFLLLELDRSFLARNYSRAKDLINYFEKHYVGWPDLLFYKFKLNLESTEEKQRNGADSNNEQLMLYANKCKSLSKTTSRKFRYDFDLCVRSL